MGPYRIISFQRIFRWSEHGKGDPKRTQIEGVKICENQAVVQPWDSRDRAVMEESDTFYGYDQTTVDPGSSLVVATIIFGVLLFSLLPCMVAFSNRYVKRQEEEINENKDTEEAAELHEENQNDNHRRLSRMSLADLPVEVGSVRRYSCVL
jgi:hypothetical protein